MQNVYLLDWWMEMTMRALSLDKVLSLVGVKVATTLRLRGHVVVAASRTRRGMEVAMDVIVSAPARRRGIVGRVVVHLFSEIMF